MEPFKMNEWQMGGSPSSATATGSEDAAPPGFRNVRKEDVTTPMKKKHITMTGLCKPPFDLDRKDSQLPHFSYQLQYAILTGKCRKIVIEMHFVLATGICADELFAFLRVAAGSSGDSSVQTCAHIAFVTGKDYAPALIMDDRYR